MTTYRVLRASDDVIAAPGQTVTYDSTTNTWVPTDDAGGGGGGGGGAVDSVNGKTGAVVLDAADVGAAATVHTHAAADITSGTVSTARLPASTTSARGAVELATEAETTTGTDTTRAVTPAGLAAAEQARLTWHPMATSTPDLSGGKRRFVRTLTGDETLDVPDSSDGDSFVIRYQAAASNRRVTLGANMMFSADFVEIPDVVAGFGLMLTFVFSAAHGKWTAVHYASGI